MLMARRTIAIRKGRGNEGRRGGDSGAREGLDLTGLHR